MISSSSASLSWATADDSQKAHFARSDVCKLAVGFVVSFVEATNQS